MIEQIFISHVGNGYWVGTCEGDSDLLYKLYKKSYFTTQEIVHIAEKEINRFSFFIWKAVDALWEYLLDMTDTESFGDKAKFSRQFLQGNFYDNKSLQDDIQQINKLPKKYRDGAFSEHVTSNVSKYFNEFDRIEENKLYRILEVLYQRR